ncbi:MAG: cytochrome P450 [Candidatus Omnitrophica bacterium]|nr:cytochrome P450 [Candidatus Omnitrophota bacterium]
MVERLKKLPKQLLKINPFDGDSKPTRIKLFAPGAGRPSLPILHPWNSDRPIDILETFFWKADAEAGPGKNNRYLDILFADPVLATRDPGIIKAILHATGDKPGQFDRDTAPSSGIARATGRDTLLYSNGPLWRIQRQLAAPSFGKSSLFQPEKFQEFEITFRQTITKRIDALRAHLQKSGERYYRVVFETEVKSVMLEMLVNNFFGAQVAYDEIRDRYVPALERIIARIMKDTAINKVDMPWKWMPAITKDQVQAKSDIADFEKLTDLVLLPRKDSRGLWKQFKSDVPDEKLRSNIRVFLAGALEATTSFATWALAHLARNEDVQEKVYQEVKNIDTYTPDNLGQAKVLNQVLEETLRLTPSLYFLPRRATTNAWVETEDGRKMMIPKGTHILLDVWHANRLEEYWGVANTGYPASIFAPQRWEKLMEKGYVPKNFLHFGFGHGARVCPGKFLGQLEVGLVVGAIVKTFKFRAVNQENPAKAGVSTKPVDGALVDLELR